MTSIIDSFFGGMEHYVAHEVEHAAEHGSHSMDSDHEHDGSGIIEIVQDLAHDIVTDMLEDAIVGGVGEMASLAGSHSSDEDHSLHVGVLTGDGFTHQTTGFTCAVVSQQMILQQFHLVDPMTGQPISESRLVYDATAHGWLSDQGGTPLSCMGNLLEYYGVPCHEGHDWHHLVEDLSAGHQVAIAVNADPLWYEHGTMASMAHLFGGNPNHALVLKGMHLDAHGHVVVVVNDPGQHDGAGVEYSLEQFQTALGAGIFHYVATNDVPPDHHAFSPESLERHDESSPGEAGPHNAYRAAYDADVAENQMSQREKHDFFRSI